MKRDCSYRLAVTFSARAAGGAKLKIQATFQGNEALLPKRAKDVSVSTR